MVITFFHRHRQSFAVLMLAAVVLLTMAVNRLDSGEKPAAAISSQVSGTADASASTSAAAKTAASQTVPTTASANEMRAVWVPYLTLDMRGETDKSEAAFIKKYTQIVQNAKAKGMNALIVHVRAFGDAMYPSKYFPWSSLTGNTQGVNPGYDPLKDMVEITHKAGLQFHAWVNPLRIQLNGVPSILAQKNPWNLFHSDTAKKDWAVSYKDGKYLDPGWEGVRQYIVDGVAEIVKNYAVDGVQFDDYFYPDEGEAFDKASYQAYCTGKKEGEALSLADWRCANINDLISRTYRAVKENRPKAVFGVSPQGNLSNDRKIGADAAAWCQAQGYVDYVCPQLYYNYDNPILPYETAVQTWKNLVTAKNVKLYFGLGLYKTDTDVDSGSWKNSVDIISRQIQTGRAQKCDGFMFYAYDDLISQNRKEEVQNVMKLFQ
ncbi:MULTISPECIES: glycoside hydrolase family 10 protein [Caproicibacterium]|uniref:Family 10 glycosylhydrolase n=1 Tax=Caproicibacterium argilliputei TaxID=3030016 RepID=A0AA97DAW2_9FIRM|nr:family 10 glycosylhydrolase [Caproicibacterium argilliputei]WOC33536.1 family 10 glycosylhydrolase [Caproicibacterium argilliputei]